MDWKEVIRNATEETLHSDLLVCADWCEEHGRCEAARQIREWAKDATMVGDVPCVVKKFEPDAYPDVPEPCFIGLKVFPLLDRWNGFSVIKYWEHYWEETGPEEENAWGMIVQPPPSRSEVFAKIVSDHPKHRTWYDIPETELSYQVKEQLG